MEFEEESLGRLRSSGPNLTPGSHRDGSTNDGNWDIADNFGGIAEPQHTPIADIAYMVVAQRRRSRAAEVRSYDDADQLCLKPRCNRAGCIHAGNDCLVARVAHNIGAHAIHHITDTDAGCGIAHGKGATPSAVAEGGR